MSRRLTPRAVDRLLELGTPLRDDPAHGAIDSDRYELGEVLGQGGMGVVYAAWDKELQRKVALKLLHHPASSSDEVRRRFLREAKAAARLGHPHIATVYDATPEAIAMQRIDGETFEQHAFEDSAELARLVRDVALAIHYAHGEGVVHRDLKPGNLMVEGGERPHAYVMDFGLAMERSVDASISLSGSVVGTPAYMAPEQASGRREDVGPATDVYGLGATMYRCLTGRAPFEGEDVYELLRRVVEEEPPPLRELAPGVEADLATIVGKCMAKEPARRYPSALALASDLDRFLRGEPVQARPASLGYRLRRYVSRRQGAFVAGTVVAVLAVLTALPFFVQARSRRIAAEEQRELAERVFGLSQGVNDALAAARAARASGVGHERTAYEVLTTEIEDCRAFLAVHDVGQARFFLGSLLRARGNRKEAVEAFDRAEELSPGLPYVRRERGLALAALFRDGWPVFGEEPPAELETWRVRAAEDLEAALAVDPDVRTPDRVFAEGQLAWVRGDVERAIERHREAVEMDVGYREAHLSLARLYLIADRQYLGMRHSIIATDLLRGFRPTYISGANPVSSSGELMEPERELLPLEGMEELLIDFSLLLQIDPSDAHTFGMRAQVLLRRAMRAKAKGLPLEIRDTLEQAEAELGATLTLEPTYAPALVNRGVCRAELAQLLARAGDTAASARCLEGALADYGAAVEADPSLEAAWFDRALLHARRDRLARLALRAGEAEAARGRARSAAARALALADATHPWRERFAELVDRLGAPVR